MGPLLWSWCGGASARPAGHRNRAAKKRRWNPGFGRRTGKSRNAMWAGRRRENRRGQRWRELERTGRKEGEGKGRKPEKTEEEVEENVTEPATGKTKTEAEYYPEEIRVEGEKRLELEAAWGTKWRELERTGRKEGEGRKETEGNTSERGRRDPWRKLYRTVERNGENSQERKRRTQRGGT